MPLHVRSTKTNSGVTDTRIFGDIHKVATCRELRTASETIGMDLSNDGLSKIPNTHPCFSYFTWVTPETIC